MGDRGHGYGSHPHNTVPALYPYTRVTGFSYGFMASCTNNQLFLYFHTILQRLIYNASTATHHYCITITLVSPSRSDSEHVCAQASWAGVVRRRGRGWVLCAGVVHGRCAQASCAGVGVGGRLARAWAGVVHGRVCAGVV